jgi:hypothetical protein
VDSVVAGPLQSPMTLMQASASSFWYFHSNRLFFALILYTPFHITLLMISGIPEQ